MKVLRVSFFCCLSLGLLCSVSVESLATEKIVFSSNRNGNSEIYMMNPDGSQQVRLTNHRANDLSPVMEAIMRAIGLTHPLYLSRHNHMG